MITTEALLRMEAEAALRLQIDSALKRPLTERALTIDTLREDSGIWTWADCSLNKAKTPVSLWGLVGQPSFRYQRITTHDFFQGVDKRVRVGFPASTEVIFRAFLRRWGIPLSGYEVNGSDVTGPGSLTVIPSDRSFRWYGPIDLIAELLTLDINDHIRASRFAPTLHSQYSSDTLLDELIVWLNQSPTNLLLEPITRDMFDVSGIEVNDRNDSSSNTRLTLSFNGTPYVGDLDLLYGRQSFPKTYAYPIPVSYPQGTTGELADILSDHLGCQITTQDILDEPLPAIGIHRTDLCLVQFRPESLGYVGEIWVEYTRLPNNEA